MVIGDAVISFSCPPLDHFCVPWLAWVGPYQAKVWLFLQPDDPAKHHTVHDDGVEQVTQYNAEESVTIDNWHHVVVRER